MTSHHMKEGIYEMALIFGLIAFVLIPSSMFLALFAFEMFREQDSSILWAILPFFMWIGAMILLNHKLQELHWLFALKPLWTVIGMLTFALGILMTIKYEMDLGHKRGLIGIVMACVSGWFLAFVI